MIFINVFSAFVSTMPSFKRHLKRFRACRRLSGDFFLVILFKKYFVSCRGFKYLTILYTIRIYFVNWYIPFAQHIQVNANVMRINQNKSSKNILKKALLVHNHKITTIRSRASEASCYQFNLVFRLKVEVDFSFPTHFTKICLKWKIIYVPHKSFMNVLNYKK